MKLRNYQKQIAAQAHSKLKELRLVYLALEARVGKTIIAFEVCRLYGAKKVLFVTKKKAIKSIEADYQYYRNDFDCTVINYESVLKAKDKYDIVICDEAHNIGTFPKQSKRQADTKKVVGTAPVILMSATPSPESHSQLFHQFTVNGAHSWCKATNFYKWAKWYVEKKTKRIYELEIVDYSNAKIGLVKRATDNYFISYTQAEAGFTQMVDEHVLICKMKDETYRIIDILNEKKIVLMSDFDILGDTKVKRMNKVHQLCSGTVIDEDGEGHTIDDSKAVFIKEKFRGQKLAIFYKFSQESVMLKSHFPNYTESPETFQSEPDTTFIGQFLSAREGTRLDAADALIFFNIDFSYLSYEQSKNRIISKERDRHTPLYFIFSDAGIERKIYELVKKKKNFTIYYYNGYVRERDTKTDN